VAAEYVAGIDAGTSGVRCAIARPGQGKIASARREWSYETMPAAPFGWTFDAERFWQLICEVTRAALAEARISPGEIAAVGVTSQRLGVVLVDANGDAIYAGPNIDARAFAQGLGIDATKAGEVYEYCGKLPSLLLAPAKLQWLQEHRPDGAKRALAVFSIADWVAYKLTGTPRAERTLSCDNGLTSATTGEYDMAFLSQLEAPESLLPPLASSSNVAAEVSPAGEEQTGLSAGMPVVIAGSDTQLALTAMSVNEPAEIGIVAGWSCPVQQVTPTPCFDEERRTWVCLHTTPGTWTLESSAADAGRAWRWWCEQLLGEGDDAVAKAATLATQAPPGSSGAVAMLGPRAMNAASMMPNLGGLLMMTPVGPAGRPQMLRAGLENIAYALRANVEQAQSITGLPASRIALGGGFTKTAIFPTMLASLLEREIDVAQDLEVSARGAALLAARAVGLSDDALRIDTKRVAPNDADVETYRRSYARWQHIGKALDEAMKGMP
jgi:sugar (pentulose or hexulose) kinase